MNDVWKPIELRHKYIKAVIDKLQMEGKTHVSIADLGNLMRDAFQVEAAADLNATYYLMTGDRKKMEGPMSYAEVYDRANHMADSHQSDVIVLQVYDDYYYIDY